MIEPVMKVISSAVNADGSEESINGVKVDGDIRRDAGNGIFEQGRVKGEKPVHKGLSVSVSSSESLTVFHLEISHTSESISESVSHRSIGRGINASTPPKFIECVKIFFSEISNDISFRDSESRRFDSCDNFLC